MAARANGGMLTRLAAFTSAMPKLVLGALALLLGISIVVGGGVSDKLGVGGYDAPSSESTHAAEFLDENFGTTGEPGHPAVAARGDHRRPGIG